MSTVLGLLSCGHRINFCRFYVKQFCVQIYFGVISSCFVLLLLAVQPGKNIAIKQGYSTNFNEGPVGEV